MQGFRWLSFCTIPIVVLVTDGLGHLYDEMRQQRLAKWFCVRLPLGITFALGLVTSILYINQSETSPFDVHKRVAYMQSVQKRLHLDHVTLLDVDMGAHMWWSGMDIVDMAGLIDVPMGHHKPHKRSDPIVAEYIFEERRPDFAHVHGNWAKRTKIPTHREWRRDYVDIGAYPISPWTHHEGSHVRRDAFVTTSFWPPRTWWPNSVTTCCSCN